MMRMLAGGVLVLLLTTNHAAAQGWGQPNYLPDFQEAPTLQPHQPTELPLIPAQPSQTPVAAAQPYQTPVVVAPQPADRPAADPETPYAVKVLVDGECNRIYQTPKKEDECEHHMTFFGDFMYLNVRGVDEVYAQAMDRCSALAVPTGPLGIVSPDYKRAFRAGFSYVLDPYNCIECSYMKFESAALESVEAPEGSVLESRATHPNTVNCSPDSLVAAASYDIDFDLINIDYKYLLFHRGPYWLNSILGARYGHLNQGFHAQYTLLGQTDVITEIGFDGVGPRAGLEGQATLGHGLMAYCNATGNFLLGNFTARYVQTNIFAGIEAETEYTNDRMVPTVDMEIGIAWTHPSNHLRVQAGYYVSSWRDIVSTPDWINAVQNNDFATNGDNLRDTMTLDGLVGRVELRF